jgi:TonB family protein
LASEASDALLQPQSSVGEVSPKMSAEMPESSAIRGAAAALVSSALPIDRDVQAIFDEGLLPKPALDFSQARATPNRASKSKHKAATSKRSGAVWKYLLLAALFLVAAGAAWYQDLVPGLPQPKNLFASTVPAASSSVVARPAPVVSIASQKTADTHSDATKTTPPSDATSPLPGGVSPSAGAPSTASPSAALPGPAKLAPESETQPSTIIASEAAEHGDAVPNVTAVPEKSVVGASSSKRSVPRTLSNAALVSATSPSDGATIVPPKLIKSVRAVAAPEALQDFATGDVKLDAVVDATGRVKSMKTLSGPPSLRSAAIDALKEYRYEPARRNGKPVAAHVTVTIKFLFEP